MTMIAEAPTGLLAENLIDRCITRTLRPRGAMPIRRRVQLQFDDLDDLLSEMPFTAPPPAAALAPEEDAERWDGLS
jgi:hypothetical protein